MADVIDSIGLMCLRSCWIPTSALIKQLCDGCADTHDPFASVCSPFGAVECSSASDCDNSEALL